MNFFRRLLRPFKDYILDMRASFYLKKVKEKKQDKDKPIKVGFIVFEPETWDKLDSIYRELLNRKNTIVELIVVPSFDKELRIITEYGNELEFFRKIDKDCIMAFDKNGWIDISKIGYEYVFYQDPYNSHMPRELRSDNVVKYAKICYIPYGYSGSDAFLGGDTNSAFFRNVSYAFIDIKSVSNKLLCKYKKNVKKGLQHFESMGYPAFDSYFTNDIQSKNINTVLWTPRWSYDSKIGGSHFLEYMNEYLKLSDKYPGVKFVLRPHPMMFRNFINTNLLTEFQVRDYLDEAKKHGVILSTTGDLREEFKKADILITDYSSIIPMFFFTGKPIVYCRSSIELNDEFLSISKGMYMTDTWEEVSERVSDLLNGNHVLQSQQQLIINSFKKVHYNSAKRIVDYLLKK